MACQSSPEASVQSFSGVEDESRACIKESEENTPVDIDSSELQEGGASALVKRRQERSLVFHLLYAAEGFEYQESLDAITDNLNRGFEQAVALDGDVFKMAQAIIDSRDSLDLAITPFLSNWRFERLSVCTRLILRMAFWELLNTDNPPVVVINEAIELTKCFAEADAYRFVNGVLDGFLKKTEREADCQNS